MSVWWREFWMPPIMPMPRLRSSQNLLCACRGGRGNCDKVLQLEFEKDGPFGNGRLNRSMF